MASTGLLRPSTGQALVHQRDRRWNRWRRAIPLYAMLLPTIAYFIVFTYYPLVHSVLISMQDFNLIGNRPFVGLENYRNVLTDPTFWADFRNTLMLGISMLTIGFVAPIVIALSLNELLQQWMKRTFQMVIYLPHLFSWAVVGGLWVEILNPDGGLVNAVLNAFGISSVQFMSDPNVARWVIILVSVWKDVGFNCVIYLAALAGINPELYASAQVDGANRWQETWYVTIPGLARTMQIVGLLSIMGVLQMFDQIFVMRNAVIQPKVDVLMTYVYDQGLTQMNIGQATASALIILVFTLLLTVFTQRLVRYDTI
ncbi:ABC transporter permease subunit [Alicyclobacillus fastidiosus]|uniref:ABC transporter permease subunit n=1 Tax=Alicyclobacillus fastidiosus TaxID=392011 RepID=A0ABY6ZB18_9BACL|nr:ABC transporter permease subunit [Alicyclobacillus fastidiosus]WAH40029.1 ABC transporter permease subunit [Alicyclobacillus fastidiosus]